MHTQRERESIYISMVREKQIRGIMLEREAALLM
jgi:hypothetical protein